MTTQALDRTTTDEATEAEETGFKLRDGKDIEARAAKAGGGLRGLWGRASERAAEADRAKGKKATGRGKVVFWAVLLHGLVLVADWVMAFATATGVIPSLAAYLHQESGAGRGQLTVDGTIALWAAPLLFLVLVLLVAELVLMRGMWRWAARRVQRIRAAAQPEPEAAPAKSGNPAVRGKKTTNRKRSK